MIQYPRPIHIVIVSLLAFFSVRSATAEILHVPRDHKTIQGAIDAATDSDTIMVAPGTYRERVRLKPGITLRSEGSLGDEKGEFQSAEATIIDGGGDAGTVPGVIMAEGSTLGGFTIVNVGIYDDNLWQKHFESRGEALGDHEGSVQAEGTTPAISIRGVSCTVTGCIVHHNGDVGIGILGGEGSPGTAFITGNLVYRNMGGGIGVAEGAEPVIRGNVCKENLRAGIGCRAANPLIIDNQCFRNVRAGIGCREASRPIIRGNQCYRNRRAGIGIRMKGTSPLVESNECFENEMAGIGCRDEASPVLRNNVCRKNKMAGIGCDGAFPLISGNRCRENEQAGIGVRGQSEAVVEGNQCHDNRLVAIGVIDHSTATLVNNDLARSGGVPPIIAVRSDSIPTIWNNRIAGGGVAAVLVQGRANVSKNTFTGKQENQGNAVWIWQGSTATISENLFAGYRTAVNASKAEAIVRDNELKGFEGSGIIVKASPSPIHVYGNSGISADPKAKMVEFDGTPGLVERNTLSTN